MLITYATAAIVINSFKNHSRPLKNAHSWSDHFSLPLFATGFQSHSRISLGPGVLDDAVAMITASLRSCTFVAKQGIDWGLRLLQVKHLLRSFVRLPPFHALVWLLFDQICIQKYRRDRGRCPQQLPGRDLRTPLLLDKFWLFNVITHWKNPTHNEENPTHRFK